MTRLLWLPEVLRSAGLTVHEVSGWRERGSSTYDPRGVICHATAGSATSTDAGEIGVLLNGSTSAPPPIAQLYLSRSGAFHVVASGKCFHAKVGWAGPLQGLGNTNLIGIEAQNDNRGQPWPAVQVDAYQRGVAAICKRMGWTAGRNVAAHREHQPGAKSDPHGIDMSQFRARVSALLAGEDDDMLTEEQVRSWVAKGLYDALYVAASGKNFRDLTYTGKGSIGESIRANLAAIVALGADTDEQAIVQGVLTGLDPAAIAAAIPPELAQQVADELAARLAS